jgi:ATP-binding cassette subfamily F protein uup
MHYVSAEQIGKSYGIKPLFEQISFHVEEGDKIALVARNGSGKSTLLRILGGKEVPDTGRIWIHKDVKVAFLEQEPRFEEEGSVLDNIFRHNHPVIHAIKAYEAASESGDTAAMLETIVHMDELGAWDFDARVKQILGKLNIHGLQQPVRQLSGGQRKRVSLAKTLIDIDFDQRHVLLLMDEPTNHLDIAMVEWLEYFLQQEKITLLLVTHDRYFLDSVCEEIWELDRNELFVYKGEYANFLEKKAARLEANLSTLDKTRNTYRKELEWMRRQPKARTTKSRSREERFHTLEDQARQKFDDPALELQMKMNRLGGKVAELKKVYKNYGDKQILKGFDYNFSKGERIGLIGPNGVGKSTFVNILQGLEKPDSGKVNIGETVVFGNYSQQGLVVKEDLRVIEYVKNIAESFPLAGGGSLSASQFLNLFLFPPEQQYTYLSSLSGGEKRRLQLLSILFRNPNFLILDEPTNDLDLPTLGVLENFLSEFPGCLLIISHDRYFMDRLVDHLLVMEGNGVIRDFPGNYSQFREQVEREKPVLPERMSPQTEEKTELAAEPGKKKISFKEKREYEKLSQEIEELTAEKTGITEMFSQGNLPFEELQVLSERIGQIVLLLEEKEWRWLELSELI